MKAIHAVLIYIAGVTVGYALGYAIAKPQELNVHDLCNNEGLTWQVNNICKE